MIIHVVDIVKFAIIASVTLWCSGWSAGLEIPWLWVRISAGQGFKRKAVYTEGAGPVCKSTGQCTLQGSVQGGG